MTSVSWSGRLLVAADRADTRRYCQPEDCGRYPLFRDPLGHLVLSATPSLLRSCEPPATAVVLHTRGCLQGICASRMTTDAGRPVAVQAFNGVFSGRRSERTAP